MNILYLHGLMSSHTSSKIDWLRLEHTVHSPHLKYKEESQLIFSNMDQLCNTHEIDLIIGSSMGGYLGFHLANKFHIPSLLFNPSIAPNDIVKPEVEVVSNLNILHTVVLGVKDDVVIPSDTIAFLKNSNSNCFIKKESNGHRTPFDIFKKNFEALINFELE